MVGVPSEAPPDDPSALMSAIAASLRQISSLVSFIQTFFTAVPLTRGYHPSDSELLYLLRPFFSRFLSFKRFGRGHTFSRANRGSDLEGDCLVTCRYAAVDVTVFDCGSVVL